MRQQTVEFRGRQKQLPVVGAPWCYPGEVFPKPNHQQPGEPGAINRIIQEEPAGFQHPGHLCDRRRVIREMFQHVCTPHDLKAGVGKGERFSLSTRKDRLRTAGPAGLAGCDVQRRPRQVQPHDPGAALHQTRHRQSPATSHIEHAEVRPVAHQRVKVGKPGGIHPREQM